jgi:glycosyltransferase involved in cell wall biosynthesis
MVAYTFYKSDPRVRREAEALAARGDTIHFICTEDGAGTGTQELNGVRLYPLGVGRYQGGSTVRYLLIYLLFFFKASFTLARLHLRNRYDLIHVHTMPDFLVFTALLPKLMGAKVILDVHDLMPELYICKFKKSDNLMIRLITWIERLSIGFADRALAVHVPHRDALIRHGNPASKFEVLMNVPDPHIFKAGSNGHVRADSKFRLVYHGTVARRHGLEVALRAIGRIKEQTPDLEFLVIGHGDDYERVQAVAGELGLNGFVKFHGRMPLEKLPAFLSQADVGVIPILYDEFTRYMLPLKLMEYVHLGIPTIVTRTETIQTYFDEQMVRFVKPGDERELADSILQLYRDPQVRRDLAGNAARFNEKFNWEAQKAGYYQLVDSMIQKN